MAHLGGGISVGSHRKGRCVKVANALFDGPMTPNRSGSLPARALIETCYSGISQQELTRDLTTRGGLLSYLGTDDLLEVERRMDAGDERAKLVWETMIEQVACAIASHVPKFRGQRIHRIILTGGMCHSRRLHRRLRRSVRPLGIKVTIYPGEREMEGLRDGALRVLRGIEQPRSYA